MLLSLFIKSICSLCECIKLDVVAGIATADLC